MGRDKIIEFPHCQQTEAMSHLTEIYRLANTPELQSFILYAVDAEGEPYVAWYSATGYFPELASSTKMDLIAEILRQQVQAEIDLDTPPKPKKKKPKPKGKRK